MNKKDKIIVDKTWSLFLDRDGVINKRIIGDYVKKIEEFHFLEDAEVTIAQLSLNLAHVFVVTNQQGIGKGLMTVDDLSKVHKFMIKGVEKYNGTITEVFFAPQLAHENHPDRKPGIGMGVKAKSLFPEVDFAKSILVGDSISDIEFGKQLGMITFFISEENQNKANADFVVKQLKDIVKYINYEK